MAGREPIPAVLVGNKSDLVHDRAVDIEQARSFAKQQGMPYYETSAKTGEGITELMADIQDRTYHYVEALQSSESYQMDAEDHSRRISENHGPGQGSSCSSRCCQ